MSGRLKMATLSTLREITLLCILYFLMTLPIYSPFSANNNGVDVVLDSFGNLLKFFSKNYQNVNLDMVFGLRVMEGQCKLLVEEFERGELEFASRDVMKRVADVGREAGKLANMAVPHVHESEREHFVMLKSLAVAPWNVFHEHRVVKPSLHWTLDSQQYNPPGFDRNDSDRCLSELMGVASRSKSGAGSKPCRVTEDCLVRMLAPGHRGFYLQHQVFYTIVAQKFGCERDVNAYLSSRTHFATLEEAQHEFCTNAYYELDDYVTDIREIPDEFRDLFLELECLCPSVGFFQFMRRAWLDAIVSWQSPEGCFPAGRLESTQRQQQQVPPDFARSNQETHMHGHDFSAENHERTTISLQAPDLQRTTRNDYPNLPGDGRFAKMLLPNYYHAPRHDIGQKPPDTVQNYRHPVPPVENPHSDRVYGYLDGRVMSRGSHGQIQDYVPVPRVQQYKESRGKELWNGDVAYVSDNGHNVVKPAVVPHYSVFAPDRVMKYPPLVGASWKSDYGGGGGGGDVQHVFSRGLRSSDLGDGTPLGRSLVRDKQLAGGCWAHFTSVASGALALYLRYLVDPGPPEFMHLRLENYLNTGAATGKPHGVRVVLPSRSGTFASAGFGDARLQQMNISMDRYGLPLGSGGARKHVDAGVGDGRLLSPKHVPVVPAPSQHGAQPDMDDMRSKAWSFMGTYQRHWGPRFQSVQGDGDSGPSNRLADYVHRAEQRKELPDWTVAIMSSVTRPLLLPSVAATSDGGRVSATSSSSLHRKEVGGVAEPRSLQVHIIEIHSPWHRDLDHYFVVVTVLSVGCLLLLFRYFRQRRYLKTKARPIL